MKRLAKFDHGFQGLHGWHERLLRTGSTANYLTTESTKSTKTDRSWETESTAKYGKYANAENFRGRGRHNGGERTHRAQRRRRFCPQNRWTQMKCSFSVSALICVIGGQVWIRLPRFGGQSGRGAADKMLTCPATPFPAP